ncbi:TonB-dependent receptor-like protein [Alteromonas sp. I10]|uniref:TonB-dependent receptor domain-containing protein n=1 Tax=Alteromonas TaxID=226 RepID=UPI000D76FA51|nr:MULTISPECIES: TonB-dependent receptor [Alteromonas]MCZ4242028.1 TonB-dependent receptor [Alteromonas macleodii]PXW74207.1 TonB-dependent receptor-like protein [Alteromonas sp. I10]
MKNIATAVQLALAGSVALTSGNVLAQDSTNESADVEKIQVTGSRISRQGAIAPSPVTAISGESLLNSGAMNIGEVLNELPSLANTFSLGNSGQFIGTAGLNILDLRGMGTDRTLVLVDGKRHVSSSAGSAAVDTNTIPTSWIERVEIVTGGASAVYGADAVTGVVNFILKKNIEGFDVSATQGFAQENGYKNDKYQASYGFNFDNDRGNIAFAAEYSSQEALEALDNPWTATSYRNMSFESIMGYERSEDQLNSTAFPDNFYTANAGYYTLNNSGVFGGNSQTFNADGSIREIYTGDQVDGAFCANCDSFNLRQFTQLQPEFDRTNLNVKGNYELNDDTTVYAQAKYARTRAITMGQPAFFYGGSETTIKKGNPFLDETVVEYMKANGDLKSIQLNRMMTDLGRRTEADERETYRYVLGIEGYMGDEWSYEAFVNYGKTELERENRNNLILQNFENALNAITDGDGNIVCASGSDDGCVPLNIMGFGQPSQEAIDYVNTTSVGTSKIEQYNAGATIANSGIYELPAGYVGFAAGVEYRKEKSEIEEPDNAAGTFFNTLGEDKGDYDVSEVFTEVTIPLLADLPGVEMLTFDTAARIANYSSIGNAKSWKLGLDWKVYEDLRLRATKSSALRAPNIGELYGEASQTFFRVDDPCRTDNLADLANADQRIANCAALGIPADFNSDYDSATLEGVNGGNIDLQAESSISKTLGVVYTPSWFKGFTATVDYWEIELTDAISSIDGQTILDRCVDSESGINNVYCGLIDRDGTTGEITQIRSYALNIAGQEAKGIDFELGYDFDALEGAFRTSLIATYLKDRKEFPFQDNPEVFYQYAGTAGESDWQGVFTINYSRGDWEASWKTRYLERSSLYDNQKLARNPNPSNRMELPSYAVTDVTAGYNFANGVSLTVGIDNLFNRALPTGTTGTGSIDGAYDNIGRFGYVTVAYKM